MQFSVPLTDPIVLSRRDTLPDCAGVYVISKQEQVIFIGAAWWDHGIRSQVDTFHTSATSGEGDHSGGITYSERYGNDTSDLTVSVYLSYGVNQDDDALEIHCKYMARRMLWEHFEQFGKLPVCNGES